MLWKSGRRSRNVEDRRGSASHRAGRRPGRLRIGRGLGGIGTIVIVLIALYFGVDPSMFLQGSAPPSPRQTAEPRSAQENQLADFVSVVLADTEDSWRDLFASDGRTYREPKLVLFTDVVRSACGFAEAAMGPFYCPADQKVYIDLGFYRDLRKRHGAPGDFAQAYVIAHEVGHHVQTLLGISQRVHDIRTRVSRTEGNQLSVRQELQADCFAGVWAKHAQRTRQVLERGDIEEALRAASSIGDDRLQRQAQGYITPESFTHGTSAQRVRWFKSGFDSGDPEQCDTFGAAKL